MMPVWVGTAHPCPPLDPALGEKAVHPFMGFPLSDTCKIKNISDLAQKIRLLKTQVRTVHTFSMFQLS